MYGLMLPSGNDAAIALAFYFGTLLLEEQEKEKVTSSDEEFDNASYEME
jgi:D-alanyl-D-alanine carboxypeptidase